MTLSGRATLIVSLLLLPPVAEAQTSLVARLRLGAGYAGDFVPNQPVAHDVYGDVRPELQLLVQRSTTVVSLQYAFVGQLHSRTLTPGALPADYANRLGLQVRINSSPRWSMVVGAEGAQSSLSLLYLNRSAGDTQAGLVPPASGQQLLGSVLESLSYEITPSLLLGQSFDATYIATVDTTTPLRNLNAGLGATIEKLWEATAVGAEARIGFYDQGLGQPTEARAVTITAMPRLRRDINRSFSALLAAGGTVIINPAGGVQGTPTGRASLSFSREGVRVDLGYVGGASPDVFTGRLLLSQQVTLRGLVPLSTKYKVTLSASAGYMHASTIPDTGTAFDSILADADLLWTPLDNLSVFARYQFIDQLAGTMASTVASSLMRHTAMLGLQASYPGASRSPSPSREPARVDGADRPAPPSQSRSTPQP